MAQGRRRRSRPETSRPETSEPAAPPEGQAERSSADRLALWKARVSHARDVRKAWEDRFHVKQLGEFFLGKQYGDESDPDNRVINYFHATVKAIVPSLMFQQPKFYVKPKPGQAPASARTAEIGEGVLEAIGAQDDHLVKVGALAVQQSLFRLGAMKVCYDPMLEPNPQAGAPITARDMSGEVVRDEETGEAAYARDMQSGEVLREPDMVLRDETFRYEWVDAHHLLLPDAGPDMTQWPWMGEEVTVLLSVAKRDERFPEEVRKTLRSNVQSLGDTRPRRPQPEGDEFFRYIEVYDMLEKTRLIWADGGQMLDEFLVDGPLPDGIEDHPYVLLAYTPIIEPDPLPWPVPPTYTWLDLQDAFNAQRRHITNSGQRSARKVLYTEGMFVNEDEATGMLQSNVDMEAVKISSLERRPEVMTVPPISMDIYRDVEMLKGDWLVVTGQSGARMGIASEGSPTDAIFAERGANLRDAELRKAVYQWLAEAGRKMLQLVKQTITTEMWITLRGFDDSEFARFTQEQYGFDATQASWYPGLKDAFKSMYGKDRPFRVKREALTFEADVTVMPGSQRPQTLESDRRVVMEFLTLLAQSPQLAMSRALLAWIGPKFDPPIPSAVLDEIHALAKQMTQVAANQAGRYQGNNQAPPEATGEAGASAGESPGVAGLMQSILARGA